MTSVKIGGGNFRRHFVKSSLDKGSLSPLLCKNLIRLDRFVKFDKWPGNLFSFSFEILQTGAMVR